MVSTSDVDEELELGVREANLAESSRSSQLEPAVFMVEKGPEFDGSLASGSFLVDSGATCHMSNNRGDFLSFSGDVQSSVRVASGDLIPAAGQGEIRVLVNDVNGDPFEMRFTALFVPQLSTRLFSVAEAQRKGHALHFFEGSYLQCRDGPRIPVMRMDRSFFLVPRLAPSERAHIASLMSRPSAANLDLWHHRLGHVPKEKILSMATGGAVSGLKIEKVESKTQTCGHDCTGTLCEACVLAKSSRAQQPVGPVERSSTPGALLHTDLHGPTQVASIGGRRYVEVFSDDCSSKKYVYFLRTKDQALEAFKTCLAEVAAAGHKTVRLHSDKGGEFWNDEFAKFCAEKGIKQTSSSPHSQAQNGVSERSWRTIFEMARAMMFHAGMPLRMWSAAVSTAVHILDRVTSRSLNKNTTPLAIWTGKPSSVAHVRVFGCLAYVHKEVHWQKLDPKARKGVFIGYDNSSRSYSVLMLDTNTIVQSRSVVFDESVFPMKGGVISREPRSVEPALPADDQLMRMEFFLPAAGTESGERKEPIPVPAIHEEIEEHHEEQQEHATPEHSEDQPLEEPALIDQLGPEVDEEPNILEVPMKTAPMQRTIRKAAMNHSVLGHGNLKQLLSGGNKMASLAEVAMRAYIDTAEVKEPQSYKEAMSSPDADEWHEAMKKEMESLEKMGTWKLVDPPEGRKIIGCKWVYKFKFNPDGSIARHKARLVAKGYSQVEGIDYNETFAPVARFTSFRMVLSMSIEQNWILEQGDVGNAFLNVTIEEELYMTQPEGFEVEDDGGSTRTASASILNRRTPRKVCRVLKGLYGFKQMPRYWNEDIHAVLVDFGLVRSQVDPCLYTMAQNGKIVFVLSLYVDDFLFGGSLKKLREDFKQEIFRAFSVTLQGEVKWLLGMEITRAPDGSSITISQRKYIDDLLSKFSMTNATPCNNPVASGLKPGKSSPGDESESSEALGADVPYQSLVGSLLYAVVCTRPDIAYAVICLTRHMKDPSVADWKAAKRILRYLKFSQDVGLTFWKNRPTDIEGFCDSD